LIQKEVERTNELLPTAAKIKKFVNLHKEFDPDEAELTRTRKLRREFMEIRYKTAIDAIFNNNESLTVDASITYQDGRKGTVSTEIRIWDI
jgi:long-chain acyl-CoA synthetase